MYIKITGKLKPNIEYCCIEKSIKDSLISEVNILTDFCDRSFRFEDVAEASEKVKKIIEEM